MVINQYQVDVNEITLATLSFIESRPLIKLLLIGMKVACLLMLSGFIVKAITHSLTLLDLAATLFAIAWLFFRRQFNKAFLKRNLIRQKADQYSREYHLSPYKIWWKENQKIPHQLLWQEIPCILSHALGYMIPLTGLQQSGRFLWLPKRGFEDEKRFVELLQKKNMKVKKIL